MYDKLTKEIEVHVANKQWRTVDALLSLVIKRKLAQLLSLITTVAMSVTVLLIFVFVKAMIMDVMGAFQ